MKKHNSLILFISVLLVLLAFTQNPLTSSTSEQNLDDKIDTIGYKVAPPPAPLEIQEVVDDYSNWLNDEIKASETVGAAVAIIYDGQIAFTKCFGVKKAGENDPIDAHTVFRLASVSKTITGVLAGILDNEQVLSLDDRVIDYIPGFRLKNSVSTENLTVRNLLSHTSGIVPHAYDNMVEGKVPMNVIMQRLGEVDVSAQPGQLYGYQNVMFSLIDTVLRAKTSKTYGELLYEKVLAPYGMNDASTDFLSFKNNPNKAYPHAKGKGRYWAQKLNDRYYSTAPAAGVNASISDMSNFLMALLKENDPVLTEEMHRAVFAPQVVSHLSRRYFRNWNRVESKHYAIGWRIVGYKGRKVAYHGGYVNGYKAEIALCENEKTGIVFLTNSPNTLATQTVPHYLDLLFEFQDTRRILTDAEEPEITTKS